MAKSKSAKSYEPPPGEAIFFEDKDEIWTLYSPRRRPRYTLDRKGKGVIRLGPKKWRWRCREKKFGNIIFASTQSYSRQIDAIANMRRGKKSFAKLP